MPFVFDSYALLVLFQEEDGYEAVASLLRKIQQSGEEKFINAINLGEIIYTTKREYGDEKKRKVLANIKRLGFDILPIPNTLVYQAAELKAQFKISYADCFALASAIEKKAVIVTGDPEFKKVQHLAEIFWI